MGLSITINQKERIVCPKCGEIISYRYIKTLNSEGRSWYNLLEKFGYYVPDSDNSWYGKDMVLSNDQAKELYQFLKKRHHLINSNGISSLIAKGLLEGHDIVINADW